jgi:predicted nuclease with TOPRIM domain
MPTLAELKEKTAELQTALDLEQQQVTDLLAEKDATNTTLQTEITRLNDLIASLEGQVAEGGTTEERQAILDSLNTIKSDLEATVAGTPPPPPPAPPAEEPVE